MINNILNTVSNTLGNLNRKSLIMSYKFENRYTKYDLTPLFNHNLP